MIILGANSGETAFGKPLKDGGAALIIDGKLVFASAQERHTGLKADGGFDAALSAGLSEFGIKGFDYAFLSSCCEPRLRGSGLVERYVDHHESHAALAFFSSNVSESLVVVCDAGGNVIERDSSSEKWWNHQRQQLSVYIGRGSSLKHIGSHFLEPLSCGLGEMYRAFTYLLGWNSGRHAGKVMALAGSGERFFAEADTARFYSVETGSLLDKSRDFFPLEPAQTAKKFLQAIGREKLYRDWVEHGDHTARLEIAKIAQWNLEEALEAIIKHWLHKSGMQHVCLSGGVALNCTAVRRLEDSIGCKMYVPPASGDNGQCVGNAILGHIALNSHPPEISDNIVFLGKRYKVQIGDIVSELHRIGLQAKVSLFNNTPELLSNVAENIFNGEIVFWFQSGGEFGARALGNRSILASPQPPLISQRLNNLKMRESFNPFASSCIYEDKDRFFVDAEDSPFMTKSFKVFPSIEHEISGVIHDDGTCRAQIFRRDFNPRFYDLIKEFKVRSNIGILLNTSLNGANEPIVETPSQAIHLLSEKPEIKFLVIDNFLIERH